MCLRVCVSDLLEPYGSPRTNYSGMSTSLLVNLFLFSSFPGKITPQLGEEISLVDEMPR